MGQTVSADNPQTEESLGTFDGVSPTTREDPSAGLEIPTTAKINRFLFADSLVAGSLLTSTDPYSVTDQSWAAGIASRSIDSNIPKSLAGTSLEAKTDDLTESVYIQPPGEPSFKNSAKIVHSYGPNGIAPLSRTRTPNSQKMIPICIYWTQGGKGLSLFNLSCASIGLV